MNEQKRGERGQKDHLTEGVLDGNREHLGTHQSFCEQLRPMLGGELEGLRLLAGALSEREAELRSLAFPHRTDSTNVSIRPLAK